MSGAGEGWGSQVLFFRTPVGLDSIQGAPALLGELLRGLEKPGLSHSPSRLSFFFFSGLWSGLQGRRHRGINLQSAGEKEKVKKHLREIRSSGCCVFPFHLLKRGGKERQNRPRPTPPSVGPMGPLTPELLRASDLRSELTLKFLSHICLSPTMGNRPTRVENSSSEALSSPRGHSGRDSHPRPSLQIK